MEQNGPVAAPDPVHLALPKTPLPEVSYRQLPKSPAKPNPALVAAIARVCHAANWQWREEIGEAPGHPWESHSAKRIRASLKAGVQYALEHPEATPEEMHEAWCAWQRAEDEKGRPLGQAIDHENLRPWAELSEAQRIKDRLFLAVVRALAPDA